MNYPFYFFILKIKIINFFWGKSPSIVDQSADIGIAAKRLTWGRFINSGQTCVAPDYICVHQDVADQLIENLKKCILEL